MAAAGLVGLTVADLHLFAAAGDALAVMGQMTALDAHRVHLVDELGQGEDRRHGPEGLAKKILIETRDDDSHTRIGQIGDQIDQSVVEELGLVDSDHLVSASSCCRISAELATEEAASSRLSRVTRTSVS